MRDWDLKSKRMLIIFANNCLITQALFANATADRNLSYLSYNEIKTLSQSSQVSGSLEFKLEKLYNSSIVDNSASRAGVKPTQKSYDILGSSMGVVTWNIEKSMSIRDHLIPALKNEGSFLRGLNSKTKNNDKKLKDAAEQRLRLIAADIIILQEMDVGHPRSGYINSPQEIARTLNMNYAYAPHQIEVDPKYFDPKSKDKVDPARYKGLFGTAVLSRYPIKKVDVIPLKTPSYDWNKGEREKLSFVEKLRRGSANVLLGEKMEREVKHGKRALQIVELEVPGQPNNTVTVVNVHLEIKTSPKNRAAQMKEILEYIEDIPGTVIMAGDFNSSAQDVSPTNLGRVAQNIVTNPSHLVSATVSATTTASTPINMARKGVNALKNFRNPMAPHIPLILPNNQRGLFKQIEKMKFSDGGCFDFRGDAERSTGGLKSFWNKKASNSNERGALSGFKPTFETERGSFLLHQRLDWMFIKSGHLDCHDKAQASYRMAPHFGEVLDGFNRRQDKEFSDHDPMYVALPLEEPVKLNEQIEQNKPKFRFVANHKGSGGHFVPVRTPASTPSTQVSENSENKSEKGFWSKFKSPKSNNAKHLLFRK